MTEHMRLGFIHFFQRREKKDTFTRGSNVDIMDSFQKMFLLQTVNGSN